MSIKSRMVLYTTYILLFFLASYITSLISPISYSGMIVYTVTSIIYWFVALIITRLLKKQHNLKQVLLKTILSLLVIMIVSTVQLLLFINIPFVSSFLFFFISLVLIMLVHLIYFKLN